MSSTKGSTDPDRKENDLYETPQWCVDILVGKVKKNFGNIHAGLGAGLQIVDIGAGDGRIGRSLKKLFPAAKLTLIDIDEPSDRLPEEEWLIEDYLGVDLDSVVTRNRVLFVGNPPFSRSTEIVLKTWDWLRKASGIDDPYTLASVAIFLLRVNWLGSERRAEWVDDNSPTRLTVLAPRPSFCIRVTVMEDGTVKKSSNDSCEYAWTWWETDRTPGPFVEVGLWSLDRAQRRVWKAKQLKLKAGGDCESCNKED